MTENTIPQISRLATAPRRIVCLTEETIETLYLLGEEARVVGVSGFACPVALDQRVAAIFGSLLPERWRSDGGMSRTLPARTGLRANGS